MPHYTGPAPKRDLDIPRRHPCKRRAHPGTAESGAEGARFIREARDVRATHRRDPEIRSFDLAAAQSLMTLSQASLRLRRTTAYSAVRRQLTRANPSGDAPLRSGRRT